VTDNSEPSGFQPDRPERRLFRQSLSAGFHTQVLTAQTARTIASIPDTQSLPPRTRPKDELARTE
jgi:hypothetical protein